MEVIKKITIVAVLVASLILIINFLPLLSDHQIYRRAMKIMDTFFIIEFIIDFHKNI